MVCDTGVAVAKFPIEEAPRCAIQRVTGGKQLAKATQLLSLSTEQQGRLYENNVNLEEHFASWNGGRYCRLGCADDVDGDGKLGNKAMERQARARDRKKIYILMKIVISFDIFLDVITPAIV